MWCNHCVQRSVWGAVSTPLKGLINSPSEEGDWKEQEREETGVEWILEEAARCKTWQIDRIHWAGDGGEMHSKKAKRIIQAQA